MSEPSRMAASPGLGVEVGRMKERRTPSRGWDDHSCQSNEVVKSVGSGARLPGCELQL